MTNTDDNSDIEEVQLGVVEIEKKLPRQLSSTTTRATTTTGTNDDNNNSDSPSVPAAAWQHAMNESLRSLPGAFHITPAQHSSNLLNPANENDNVGDDESTTARRPTVLPEHDIAVEAYAVNDNDDNNNNRTAANTNNDVEYGQQQQPTTSLTTNTPIAQVVPTILGIEKRRFKQISLLFGVILIIVVVVLSVVLVTNNNNNNSDNNNNNTDPGGLINLPPVDTKEDVVDTTTANEEDNNDDHQSIIIKNERRQKLINTISPLVKEGTFDQFNNSNNTNTHNTTGEKTNPTGNKYIDDRIATLEWLLQDLSREEFFNNSTNNNIKIPNWKVQQRYVLALLYISTTSNNNILGTQWVEDEEDEENNNNNDWYRKLNFLSNRDECEWYASRTICNTYPNIGVEYNLEDCPTEYLENNVETKGVSCSSTTGKVTRISLYENNLIGELPPELSVLSEINTLYFVTNKISGNIPSSFGNMTKLASLLLGNNCLTGSIPSELFDLNIEVSNYHMNSKLTGSLNGFCSNGSLEGGGPREGVNFIAADCGSCPYAVNGDPATLDLFGTPNLDTVVELTTGAGINYTASAAVFNVECDCCTCCDPISEMCCNSDGSFAFPAGVEKTECSL